MASFDKLKQRWGHEATAQADRAEAYKHQLLKKGTPLFRKYKIRQVYIFGSVASGRYHKNSDIDLFVSELPAERYWQFRQELEEVVQLPIDLYTDSDDPVFVDKIISRGEKIYEI